MGLRFRRKIKILPGVSLNIGKRGVSTSIGVKGAHITIGKNGTRTTVGIPGTGLSYTSTAKSTVDKDPLYGVDEFGDTYLKKCPFCGHGMRKQWDTCPACHEDLTFAQDTGPSLPLVTKCPKCGEEYGITAQSFCGRCGTRMNYGVDDEYPEEITPDIQEFLDKMDCIACPKCHCPSAKKQRERYCKNCGARLPHIPVPEMAFGEGVKLFLLQACLVFVWSLILGGILCFLVKFGPFLMGLLFFKAIG